VPKRFVAFSRSPVLEELSRVSCVYACEFLYAERNPGTSDTVRKSVENTLCR
jgi:hypothetical protein